MVWWQVLGQSIDKGIALAGGIGVVLLFSVVAQRLHERKLRRIVQNVADLQLGILVEQTAILRALLERSGYGFGEDGTDGNESENGVQAHKDHSASSATGDRAQQERRSLSDFVRPPTTRGGDKGRIRSEGKKDGDRVAHLGSQAPRQFRDHHAVSSGDPVQ